MEYLLGINVVIETVTNKSTEKVELNLGEHDEDETVKDLIERIKEKFETLLS